MTPVFADTSYWFAALDPRDQWHDATVRAAVAKIRELRTSPNVSVIGQTAAQFDAALTYYGSRLDKRWGITDCASFLAMNAAGITHALTADRDFEQAGFSVLM